QHWLSLANLFFDRILLRRKIYFERGSMSGFAVNLNHSVVLVVDPVGQGESQSSPFSCFLGREEGLKDALLCIGIHPCTGIGDTDLNILSRPSIGTCAAVALVDYDVLSLDDEF